MSAVSPSFYWACSLACLFSRNICASSQPPRPLLLRGCENGNQVGMIRSGQKKRSKALWSPLHPVVELPEVTLLIHYQLSLRASAGCLCLAWVLCFSLVFICENQGGSAWVYFVKCPAVALSRSGYCICAEGEGAGERRGWGGESLELQVTGYCWLSYHNLATSNSPGLGCWLCACAPHVLFFAYQENPAKWLLSSFYR